MSQSFVPQEVAVDFLRHLRETLSPVEPVILVLRGSLLLQRWFGASARSAADIDLECFERVRGQRRDNPRQRFPSVVDHARGLCCFAAEASRAPGIEFEEIDPPEGGESLWTYGAPGERFFLGWVWHDRRGLRGRLQLDIAESGSYDLADISIDEVSLTTVDGSVFTFLAYTPEMLLAAKLSWLVRSITRRIDSDGVGAIQWTGEPKDLFDVHLLLTRMILRSAVFQKALLEVGINDELNWNNLQTLFCVRPDTMSDKDFANWEDFRRRHVALVHCGPVEMVQTVAERLEGLLGDFYFRQEMPFLLAINADPQNEGPYLIYADWLDDHSIDRWGKRALPRCQFVRLLTKFLFHEDDLPLKDFARLRKELQDLRNEMSAPWMHQFFGTPARFREIWQRILDFPQALR